MTTKKRVCLDCRRDISNRSKNAKRCRKCAMAAAVAGSKRWQREQTTARAKVKLGRRLAERLNEIGVCEVCAKKIHQNLEASIDEWMNPSAHDSA